MKYLILSICLLLPTVACAGIGDAVDKQEFVDDGRQIVLTLENSLDTKTCRMYIDGQVKVDKDISTDPTEGIAYCMKFFNNNLSGNDQGGIPASWLPYVNEFQAWQYDPATGQMVKL